MARFICQSCEAEYSKWKGQCDICKEWNTIVEEVIELTRKTVAIPDNFFVSIDDNVDKYVSKRYKTNLEELNRVLGGGFVDGSVILLSGAPGIGKSTLLLQIMNNINELNEFVYISAEESVGQVLMRAQRINISNSKLKIASASNMSKILSALQNIKPQSIVIIDSIQTVSSDFIQSPAGSISQVRACTLELVNFAKEHNVIIIIVGHVTKDGTIAGPKTLEHMVDIVLNFEGDKVSNYRILRGEKNRYGAIDEIGVFSMESQGLVEVSNPSAAFLSSHDDLPNGVAVFAGLEGTRSLLFEIQALVSVTNLQIPRRSAVGFDINRLIMILAVISNKTKLNFSNKDVYVNVAGGFKIVDPAADLAVAMAIISAIFKKSLNSKAVYFGELGLSGEIRKSYLAYNRLKEASKLGFTTAYCCSDISSSDNINIHALLTIRHAIQSVE